MVETLAHWFLRDTDDIAKDDLRRAHFRLAFRYLLYFFLFNLSFSIFLYINDTMRMATVTLINSIGILLALLSIRWTGTVKMASKLYLFFGLLTPPAYILLSQGEIGILNGLWFIPLTVFVYFNLGRKWGLLCFLAVIVVFNPIAYLKFNGFEALDDVNFTLVPYRFCILIELIVAFTFMYYVIKEFIDARLAAESNLKRNQEQLSALLAAIPDRMLRMDAEGNYLQFKLMPEKALFPLNAEDSPNINELPISPKSKETLRQAVQKAIETGELQTYEEEYNHPTEGHRYFEARVIKSGENEVVNIIRDITVRKTAEKELAETTHFVERILKATPNLMWIHNFETGRNTWANKEVANYLGYSPDIKESAPDFMIYPDDRLVYNQHIQKVLTELKDGEVAELEYRAMNNKGQPVWLHARRIVFSRNEQGKVREVLGVAEDIGDHIEAEEQLRIALEAARQASIEKAQFLSTMSHEIRTPLNSVIGNTYLLLQEDPKPEQVETLQTLLFSANHLLALINDILDFSKIEAGKIEFEKTPFRLPDLVENILNMFSIGATDKGIRLELGQTSGNPHALLGDTVRLNQILTNLVSNAIKFTEKGEVTIGYQVVEEQTDTIRVRFNVKDTGIGIPEKKLKNIFDSFTQASSETTRKYGGTGLGLSICKRLVEMQGGEIYVTSNEGEGSEFIFTLRFDKDPNAPKKVNASFKDAVKSLEGMHILLVEDNKVNQVVAMKFMNKWGAEVDVAENGQVAVDKVQQKSYDLVLMDLQMPVMDGYRAAQTIRELPDSMYGQLPIVALTANASGETRNEVMKKGMNDYITKPFNPEEMYTMLRTFKKEISPAQ